MRVSDDKKLNKVCFDLEKVRKKARNCREPLGFLFGDVALLPSPSWVWFTGEQRGDTVYDKGSQNCLR